MATIHDVAKRAGVSSKTVSRVINNYPQIRESTRQKVLRVIEELEYVPNIHAQSMSSGRTRILGIYRCDQHHYFARNQHFFGSILEGFETELTGTGFRLLLDAPWLHGDLPSLRVLAGQVDGLLILNAPNANEREQLQAIREKLPVVTIGRRHIDGYDTHAVGQDNVASTRLAVRHLAGLGHTRIGLLYHDGGGEHDKDRLSGYQEVLRELGLPLLPRFLLSVSPQSPDDCDDRLSRWLTEANSPSSVFAGTEWHALQLLRIARQLGRRVPEDLAVVTFEDSYASELADPPLSVIRRPSHQLGREAAAMLLKLVHGEEVQSRVRLLPPELVVRGSCGGHPLLRHLKMTQGRR